MQICRPFVPPWNEINVYFLFLQDFDEIFAYETGLCL